MPKAYFSVPRDITAATRRRASLRQIRGFFSRELSDQGGSQHNRGELNLELSQQMQGKEVIVIDSDEEEKRAPVSNEEVIITQVKHPASHLMDIEPESPEPAVIVQQTTQKYQNLHNPFHLDPTPFFDEQDGCFSSESASD